MRNLVVEAFSERRSRRDYTDKGLSKDLIADMVKVALSSPSAMNKQPWHLTVIENKEIIKEIEKDTIEILKQEHPGEMVDKLMTKKDPVFYNAPVVFIISVPNAETLVDVGIMAQSINVTAYSLGLGSVILGLPQFVFMGKKGDSWREKLQFPKDYNYGIAIAVGYAVDEPMPKDINYDKVTYIK